jgi:hypothetical protein
MARQPSRHPTAVAGVEKAAKNLPQFATLLATPGGAYINLPGAGKEYILVPGVYSWIGR